MADRKFCFKMLEENFLDENHKILEGYSNCYIILEKLKILIEQIMAIDETYDLDKALFELPLHFNAFVLENLKEEYWKEKYE